MRDALGSMPRWTVPSISTEVRTSLVHCAERADAAELPEVRASSWLECERTGIRAEFDAVQAERRDQLRDLVVGEAVEGGGRFLVGIADVVWSTCEETWWGVPAHLAMQGRSGGLPDAEEPLVDLWAAETAATLAWTVHLLGDALEVSAPGVVDRVRAEVRRRFLEPCLLRDDFWWMGEVGYGGVGGYRVINNWNPWICSNWIIASLLLDEEPRRSESVAKALRVLDRYVAELPEDGACEEGTAYWGRAGATLFEGLEVLVKASGGRISPFEDLDLAEVARFPARMRLAGDWFVNFGDGSPRPHLPPGVIYRFGRSTADAAVYSLGADLLRKWRPGVETSRHESLARTLGILDVLDEAALVSTADTAPTFTWLPGDEVMVARQHSTPGIGFAVAGRARHNGTPHGHNDVGTFVLSLDDQPVVIDAGIGTYTAATFGPDRFEIWTIRSAYHNVPLIGEVEQSAGADRTARGVRCTDDGDRAELELDLALAYPESAGVQSWRRVIALARPTEEITVTDDWQLDDSRPVALHLLLRDEPAIHDRHLTVTGTAISFAPEPQEVSTERIPLEDDTLVRAWDRDALWRVAVLYPTGSTGSVTTRFARTVSATQSRRSSSDA